jgi:hypothetical protein
MVKSLLSLFVAALLVSLSAAQQSGWDPNQVNTTMCYWTTPRGTPSDCPDEILNPTDQRTAAVIRDTLYIDGGYLWWQPGMSDGTYGPLIADGKGLL